MRINFLVNEVHGGWEPTDTRLGGTERGVVEWAEELAKRGHSVVILRNGHTPLPIDAWGWQVHNGVTYHERTANVKADITINVKSAGMPIVGPTIYYTNEIDADKLDLSEYDAVIHISNWAKDNIPVNNPNVHVVPHGYDELAYYPLTKVPKQCLYASSPDRGLEVLLRAWPKVLKAHPTATLKVTYGAEPIAGLPNVDFLGDVSESEMANLFRQSDIWCHPCTGIELQCIAGLKAQAAGCWPVIIPAMALQETVHYGTFVYKDNYADKLIEALDGHPEHSHPGITIKQSTDKLLEVIELTLDGHTSRKPTRR